MSNDEELTKPLIFISIDNRPIKNFIHDNDVIKKFISDFHGIKITFTTQVCLKKLVFRMHIILISINWKHLFKFKYDKIISLQFVLINILCP